MRHRATLLAIHYMYNNNQILEETHQFVYSLYVVYAIKADNLNEEVGLIQL